jgi:LAO/AO transport system kinase
MTDPLPDLPGLLERARAGHRRSVGRLLSVVEHGGDQAEELDTLTLTHAVDAGTVDAGDAHVVGVTGAPGAGKSTLTGALAMALAGRGRRTAVVAVDPSSPVTGGAILGDRIRMDDTVGPARDHVFIRSMATRGQRGGLALAVPGAVRVLAACGFDTVVVETTGVGQVEIDIVAGADTTVVVLNPGWGDAIQANKAGIMEIADVFVVNKADRPGADDTVRDVERMLDLGHRGVDGTWRPPVVRTVATDGTGTEALLDALDAHLARLRTTGELAERRTRRVAAEVRTRITHDLEDRLTAALAAETAAITDAAAGRTTPGQAAQRIAARLRLC